MRIKSKSYLVARIFEICIGAYFIIGVIPKALNIDAFAVQLSAYKVISSPSWLMAAALFTVFVEISLGAALILKLRLKGLSLVAMQGMLIFFTGLILYSWRVHGLEDCGCFPVFKMSPEVSTVKNTLIFLAGCYMAWRFYLKSDGDDKSAAVMTAPRLRLGLLKMAVALIIAGAGVTYAWQDMDPTAFMPPESDQGDGIFAQFELYLDEGYFNLGDGLYLVPIISMNCAECIEKAPDINDLVMLPDVPPIVALCYEEGPGDMEEFRAIVMPEFALHSIGDRALLYYRLIDQEPFRLSLVNDGREIHAWDGYVPEYEELITVMETLGLLL